MVGLRKLKGLYYARVYLPRPGYRSKEKLISLRTDNKREAAIRRVEVQRYESELKAGMEYTFPWKNGNGLSEVVRLTVDQAIKQYQKARKTDRLRSSTLELYKLALNHFSTVVGRNTPVELINHQHIEKYKEKFISGYSDTTVNIYLRSIRPFLNWLYDRGEIKSVPKISLIKTGKPLPIYLSNGEFAEILKAVSERKYASDDLASHYQKAFHFYRETGCRLQEPFYATIHGNWMIIEADCAKTHRSREVYLTDNLILIVNEIQDRFNRFEGKSKDDFIKRFSVIFQKACKAAGIEGKKFHCLRHTFAVRRYLQTRDIYQVAKELGHSDIKTTQIYANFNLMRLAQDFPDLAKDYGKPGNTPESSIPDTVFADTGIIQQATYRR